MKDRIQPLSFTDVTIEDDFWTPRIETISLVSLEHQYDHIQANGCLDNFRRVIGEAGGEFEGPPFMDANAYKWLEAASYTLATEDMPTLAEKVDKIVSLLERTQSDDGYLFTYFMISEEDMRWTNLTMMHELYCAGHLIEAAVAHHRATEESRLLEIGKRLADHVYEQFGPEGAEKIPGHQEIELALVRLYRVTDDERYLELVECFIDRRGRDSSPLAAELPDLAERGGNEVFGQGPKGSGWSAEDYQDVLRDETGEYDGTWAQDERPVREQETVEGHSVRAANFYSAIAAYLQEVEDQELFDTVKRVWHDMVTSRMYITGGVGSDAKIEGTTGAYYLPNETASAETCASVSTIFWGQYMFELTGDGEYGDVIERILYNGLLSGMSLDGTRYSYSNPLASDGDYRRKRWFYIACCPPNLSRLLASLSKYIYAKAADELFVTQYIGSTVETTISGTDVKLEQTTDYPWGGTVTLGLSPDEPTRFSLSFRVPEWTDFEDVRVNGERVSPTVVDNFASIEREWSEGDEVTISIPIETDVVVAHPDVKADEAHAALKRGPIVYCLEGVDNAYPVHHLIFSDSEPISARFDESLLGGVTLLEGDAVVQEPQQWQDNLYRSRESIETTAVDFTAIPYYAWNNRGRTGMTVWMRLA